MLFASLVDDPDGDPHYLKPNGSLDEEAAGIKRADLFNLIEEQVMWENSNNPQVIVAEGNRERVFLPPTQDDERVSESAKPQNYPETDLPDEALGFRVQKYGMLKHYQLFTNRQILEDAHCDPSYADAVVTYLAFALDRVVDRHSSIATWDSSPSKLQLRNTFARHAIQMTWDFGEGNPLCMSSGTWTPSVDFVAKVIVALPSFGEGSVQQRNAAEIVGKGFCFSTDPPYYDNVPYADLSDFFYIWLGQEHCRQRPGRGGDR